MNELNKTFSRNLQYYLLVRDMQQKELAEKLGVSKAAVSLWCSGETIPRMSKVESICQILGCTKSDLLERELPKAEQVKFEIPADISEEKKAFIRSVIDMPDEKLKALIAMIKAFKG